METKNFPRNTSETPKKDDDFEFYLKNSIPTREIIAILKAQKKDQKEIDTFVEKYEVSKKQVNKMLNKFIQKIEYKYGVLDETELLGKGLKFAAKHKFTEAEKSAFIRKVLKGNIESPLIPDEFANTTMSKFFGLNSSNSHLLDIKAPDQAALAEIVKKYNENKLVYFAVNNQSKAFDDDKFKKNITDTTQRTKVNKYVHVHPLVVALFGNKIDYIDEKMVVGNIGRMVAMRSRPLVNFTETSVTKAELLADMNLLVDFSRDPNGLSYFSNDTPMVNLLKRFLIQIKLWFNVLAIRDTGKVYSKNTFDTMKEDGITAFLKALSEYEWTYFDSPELFQYNDECTVLKKIMAVFSWRPTNVQIVASRAGTIPGATTLGDMQSLVQGWKTQFITIPVINIKLNHNAAPTDQVPLNSSLEQTEWFLENKMFVPKQRKFYSTDRVLLFNIIRKYQKTVASGPITAAPGPGGLTFAHSGLVPMGFNVNSSVDICMNNVDVQFTPDVTGVATTESGKITTLFFALRHLNYITLDAQTYITANGIAAHFADQAAILTKINAVVTAADAVAAAAIPAAIAAATSVAAINTAKGIINGGTGKDPINALIAGTWDAGIDVPVAIIIGNTGTQQIINNINTILNLIKDYITTKTVNQYTPDQSSSTQATSLNLRSLMRYVNKGIDDKNPLWIAQTALFSVPPVAAPKVSTLHSLYTPLSTNENEFGIYEFNKESTLKTVCSVFGTWKDDDIKNSDALKVILDELLQCIDTIDKQEPGIYAILNKTEFKDADNAAHKIDNFIAANVLPYLPISDYPGNTIRNAAAFAAKAANDGSTDPVKLIYKENINIIKHNLLILYRYFCKISATVLVYSN